MWRTVFDVTTKKERIQKIEKDLEDPKVWGDQEKSIALSKELSDLKDQVEEIGKLIQELKDLLGITVDVLDYESGDRDLGQAMPIFQALDDLDIDDNNIVDKLNEVELSGFTTVEEFASSASRSDIIKFVKHIKS